MKNNKFLYGLFAVCACAVSAYLFHELLAWFAPDDLGGVLVAAGSHENPAQIVRREPCEEFMKQIRTYGTCADGEQAVEKFVVFHIVGN